MFKTKKWAWLSCGGGAFHILGAAAAKAWLPWGVSAAAGFSGPGIRLTQTLVGAVGCGSPPGSVVEERSAGVTVVAGGVVFAVANQPAHTVLHTLAGMAVTLTPATQKHTWMTHNLQEGRRTLSNTALEIMLKLLQLLPSREAFLPNPPLTTTGQGLLSGFCLRCLLAARSGRKKELSLRGCNPPPPPTGNGVKALTRDLATDTRTLSFRTKIRTSSRETCRTRRSSGFMGDDHH